MPTTRLLSRRKRPSTKMALAANQKSVRLTQKQSPVNLLTLKAYQCPNFWKNGAKKVTSRWANLLGGCRTSMMILRIRNDSRRRN